MILYPTCFNNCGAISLVPLVEMRHIKDDGLSFFLP